jgi:hypothetical protein
MSSFPTSKCFTVTAVVSLGKVNGFRNGCKDSIPSWTWKYSLHYSFRMHVDPAQDSYPLNTLQLFSEFKATKVGSRSPSFICFPRTRNISISCVFHGMVLNTSKCTDFLRLAFLELSSGISPVLDRMKYVAVTQSPGSRS